MITTEPPARPPAPPVIERPAPNQVSYGIVEGRAAVGMRRVIVRVDGAVVRDLPLAGRRFVVDVPLPSRDLKLRVETVGADGRRSGTTVAPVFGLPRAARPSVRIPRLDTRLQVDVQRLAARFPGTSAVYVENLATGAASALNARATFPAASTLKLSIAVTVLSRTYGPPSPGSSLDRLAELFACVGRGDHAGADGQPPATVCVLSGDVHHAYAARADYHDPSVRSAVYQLTCSPVHNYVPRLMKVAFRVAWSRAAERTTRFLLDRVARLPHQPLDWDRVAGPYYGNEIATLTLDGRKLTARILSPGGAKFSVMPAAPLPTSPKLERQQIKGPGSHGDSNGARKLAIELREVSSLTLTVMFSTEDGAPIPKLKPLSKW